LRYTFSKGKSKVQVTKTEANKLGDARDLLFALSKHSKQANAALDSMNQLICSIGSDGVVQIDQGELAQGAAQ
jgi:hypothetical protein